MSPTLIISIIKCSNLGAIRKSQKYIDHSTTITLYKSLVLPPFDSSDTVYMTANKNVLNKLHKYRMVHAGLFPGQQKAYRRYECRFKAETARN